MHLDSDIRAERAVIPRYTGHYRVVPGLIGFADFSMLCGQLLSVSRLAQPSLCLDGVKLPKSGMLSGEAARGL